MKSITIESYGQKYKCRPLLLNEKRKHDDLWDNGNHLGQELSGTRQIPDSEQAYRVVSRIKEPKIIKPKTAKPPRPLIMWQVFSGKAGLAILGFSKSWVWRELQKEVGALGISSGYTVRKVMVTPVQEQGLEPASEKEEA